MKNKYALDNPIDKIDLNKSDPVVKNTKFNISISFISIQKLYISIEFEVPKNNNTRNADGNQISLVNFGPFAFFSEGKLVTSFGVHLKKVDNLHTICLRYKLLTSRQQTFDLNNGFEEPEPARRSV